MKKEIVLMIAGLLIAFLIGCYSTSETINDGGTPVHICTCLCLVNAPYYSGCAYREAENVVLNDEECKNTCSLYDGYCNSYNFKCTES